MGEKLQILLSEEQTEKYFEICRAKTSGEIDEGCEPSGPTITVHVAPMLDSEVYVNGHDLGNVSVEIIERL